ncbi:hypothetical protein [Larkinella sp. C7]|jgi:hypothetical protein|uniref:hypothetical protein n=1 Tax=Larkinella sp. C7 TaxID=2576607 RepID=UPI00111117A0|nr:hypothetical protein [Larkinella sp. C7]
MAKKSEDFNVRNTHTTAKYPYKDPFLSKPEDNDLSKQWVVEYGIWSIKKQRVVRKRVVLSGNSINC